MLKTDDSSRVKTGQRPQHAAQTVRPVEPLRVVVHGVGMHRVTEAESIDYILKSLAAGCGGWVVTANLDHLRRLVDDTGYRDLCAGATLIVADGMPLIWASRLRGTPLPERVAGSSLITTLSEAVGRAGRSVFLLGGSPGTAEAAAKVLESQCPGLRVAGSYCPRMGFEDSAEEMATIKRVLNEGGADIIYVALGSPKQEWLIDQLRPMLSEAWWMGVGISFSFVTGQVKRAPRWMQRCGLEWLHRLCQEPRRLARRYLIDGIPFAVRLLVRSVWDRFVASDACATKQAGQIDR